MITVAQTPHGHDGDPDQRGAVAAGDYCLRARKAD